MKKEHVIVILFCAVFVLALAYDYYRGDVLLGPKVSCADRCEKKFQECKYLAYDVRRACEQDWLVEQNRERNRCMQENLEGVSGLQGDDWNDYYDICQFSAACMECFDGTTENYELSFEMCSIQEREDLALCRYGRESCLDDCKTEVQVGSTPIDP